MHPWRCTFRKSDSARTASWAWRSSDITRYWPPTQNHTGAKRDFGRPPMLEVTPPVDYSTPSPDPASRTTLEARRREDGRERTKRWRERVKARKLARTLRALPRLRRKRERALAPAPSTGYAARVKHDGLEALRWFTSHHPMLIAQGLLERAGAQDALWWWRHRDCSIAA